MALNWKNKTAKKLLQALQGAKNKNKPLQGAIKIQTILCSAKVTKNKQ
jgi:hypothetical protein